jgi:hypothetical protein
LPDNGIPKQSLGTRSKESGRGGRRAWVDFLRLTATSRLRRVSSSIGRCRRARRLKKEKNEYNEITVYYNERCVRCLVCHRLDRPGTGSRGEKQ